MSAPRVGSKRWHASLTGDEKERIRQVLRAKTVAAIVEAAMLLSDADLRMLHKVVCS